MGKNQSASGLTNIVQYDTAGNISLVSGSTTLLYISSSGAITTTGVISGSNALSASYAVSASNSLAAQTASFVQNAQSASYVLTAQTASFVANAQSASYVLNAQSSSYVLTAQTASYVLTAQTASFVANAQSASNAVAAQTASFANAFTVAGTLTAQTLVVQTITSSVDFVTGSTRFGSILGNTHVFSGSVTMNPGGLFVSSSGLVGIGNVVPAYTLDVSGTGRFTGALSGTSATFSSGLIVSNITDVYPEFKTSAADADAFLGFSNTGDGNNAWSIGRRNTGEFWISNYTGNFNSGTRTQPLIIASTGAATFSSSVTATNALLSTRLAVGLTSDQTYASIFIGGAATTGTTQYAIIADPQLSGTDNYALFANARIKANTAVTNTFGVYIPSAEKLSGATITNNYALYIANQTSGATLNYSIYSSGGLNYFGGNMSIGTTTSPTSGGFTNTTLLVKQVADGGSGGGLQIEQNSTDNVASFGFSGNAFRIGTSYRFAGSYQPILISAGGSGNQLYLNTNGNVLIGTTTDNSFKLAVASGTQNLGSGFVVNNDFTTTGRQCATAINDFSGTTCTFDLATIFPRVTFLNRGLCVTMQLIAIPTYTIASGGFIVLTRTGNSNVWSNSILANININGAGINSVSASGTVITIVYSTQISGTAYINVATVG